MGFRARQRGSGDGNLRKHDPANSPGGEWRGGSPGASDGGRSRCDREAPQRGNGGDGRAVGDSGSGAAAIQRVQSAVAPKPGEARDPRYGGVGGHLNLIQWATSPWGQHVPIHISWTLLWVAGI